MTIALRAAGTIVAGTTSAAPSYPAGIAAGDIVFLYAGWKDESLTAPTISGWTIVANRVFGSGADGVATGQQRLVVWRKDTVAGGESGTVTVTPTGGSNVVEAGIVAWSKTNTAWDLLWDWADDTTAAANLSATSQNTPSYAAGDWQLLFAVHGANSNMGSTTVTATGVTYGAATEHADVGSSNGNALRLAHVSRSYTSGTATSVITFSSTITATTTGGAHLLRLRETAGGLTQVTQTAASAWRVVAAVTATVNSAARVLAQVTATRNSAHRVLAPVTATAASAYRVTAHVTATAASAWRVPAHVTATTSSGWRVLAGITASAASAWNVEAASQTNYSDWAGPVTATTWAEVTATASSGWRVLAHVTSTKSSAHRVLEQASSTRASSYRILQQITATRGSAWNVQTTGTVTQQAASAWRILETVTATRSSAFDVLTTVTATAGSGWRILAGVTATAASAWAIDAQVTATRNSSWSIAGKVTAEQASSWDILARITATQTSAWDVLAQIGVVTRDSGWRILAGVTATRSSGWTIIGRVTASRDSAWTVKARVNQTVPSAWDILTATTATRSTAYRVLEEVTRGVASAWVVEQVLAQPLRLLDFLGPYLRGAPEAEGPIERARALEGPLVRGSAEGPTLPADQDPTMEAGLLELAGPSPV